MKLNQLKLKKLIIPAEQLAQQVGIGISHDFDLKVKVIHKIRWQNDNLCGTHYQQTCGDS